MFVFGQIFKFLREFPQGKSLQALYAFHLTVFFVVENITFIGKFMHKEIQFTFIVTKE